MGGLLAAVQEKVLHYLRRLTSGEADRKILAEARQFAATELLLAFPEDSVALPPGRQQEVLIGNTAVFKAILIKLIGL